MSAVRWYRMVLPEMSAHTWQPDWPFRIYSRLEEAGFHSLSEFLDSRPMDSLIAIADELGTDVAAVQLEALWYREASERGQMARFLSSLLIRCIRRALPGGWSRGDRFEFKLAGAFATWARVVDEVLPAHERDAIRDELRSMSPIKGWLPAYPYDETTARLVEAVDAAFARSTHRREGHL